MANNQVVTKLCTTPKCAFTPKMLVAQPPKVVMPTFPLMDMYYVGIQLYYGVFSKCMKKLSWG
jgi:hypothetical protein